MHHPSGKSGILSRKYTFDIYRHMPQHEQQNESKPLHKTALMTRRNSKAIFESPRKDQYFSFFKVRIILCQPTPNPERSPTCRSLCPWEDAEQVLPLALRTAEILYFIFLLESAIMWVIAECPAEVFIFHSLHISINFNKRALQDLCLILIPARYNLLIPVRNSLAGCFSWRFSPGFSVRCALW